VVLMGPLNALTFGMLRFYILQLGGIKSFLPGFTDEHKPYVRRWFQDAMAGFGTGASLDNQQGLSPFYARPTKSNSVEQSAVDAYRDISVPVSLWYGTKDASVPMASAEWLQDLIPDSKLHKVDGDHSLMFYNVDEILDELVTSMEQTDGKDGATEK